MYLSDFNLLVGEISKVYDFCRQFGRCSDVQVHVTESLGRLNIYLLFVFFFWKYYVTVDSRVVTNHCSACIPKTDTQFLEGKELNKKKRVAE